MQSLYNQEKETSRHNLLKKTAFIYVNKYYKQIIGGAMGSPFTLTLANIFILYWEIEILCPALGPNEIYGR
jgi:hypothetical protein